MLPSKTPDVTQPFSIEFRSAKCISPYLITKLKQQLQAVGRIDEKLQHEAKTKSYVYTQIKPCGDDRESYTS